jgi:hypothetical protein
MGPGIVLKDGACQLQNVEVDVIQAGLLRISGDQLTTGTKSGGRWNLDLSFFQCNQSVAYTGQIKPDVMHQENYWLHFSRAEGYTGPFPIHAQVVTINGSC